MNAKDFASCPVPLPNREAQDGIVELLDSLSDKIRVNNRLNDYLAAEGRPLRRRFRRT